jgi:hypothetical protein
MIAEPLKHNAPLGAHERIQPLSHQMIWQGV